MDKAKPFPASQPEPTKAPPPATNERPRLRRSAAVREYITRMVAGMNGKSGREIQGGKSGREIRKSGGNPGGNQEEIRGHDTYSQEF